MQKIKIAALVSKLVSIIFSALLFYSVSSVTNVCVASWCRLCCVLTSIWWMSSRPWIPGEVGSQCNGEVTQELLDEFHTTFLRYHCLVFVVWLPGAVRSETVEPVTVRPVTVEPGTVRSETVEPVTVRPVTVEPVTVRPGTVGPVTVEPVTVRPGTVGQDWLATFGL